MGTLNLPASIFGTPGGAGSTTTVPVRTLAAEQDIGTLTWTGTTAPSGTIAKKYRWVRVGYFVTFFFKITATVPGLADTAVSFALPGDVPVPVMWASQPASTHVAVGPGLIGSTANPISATGGTQLTLDGGSVPTVRVTDAAVAATNVWGSVSYLAAL